MKWKEKKRNKDIQQRFKPVRFMRPSSSYLPSSMEKLLCIAVTLTLFSFKTNMRFNYYPFKSNWYLVNRNCNAIKVSILYMNIKE
jgi:hypothetical protein